MKFSLISPYFKIAMPVILIILFISLGSCDRLIKKNILPDPLQAGWQGEDVCELLHEDEKLRVLRCTFAPGVGHERHYHNPHFGYAISGGKFSIKDTNGIREVEIASGANFTSEGVKWHEVLNIGDSTSVFLIIEPKK